MKICRACGELKPIQEYYKHPQMADGYLNFCKECVKERERNRRAADLEKYRAYDRARAFTPERVALRRKRAEKVKADPLLRGADHKSKERWRDKNFVKRRAHIMVRSALKYGHLTRPESCSRCAVVAPLDAHHEDYYKPLEVTWLCETCHGLRHREINEERRKAS